MRRNIKTTIINFCTNICIIFLKIIRPQFGPRGVCIHQITCSLYAEQTLKTKPFYKAFFIILIRLASCNPITAYFKRYN